MTPRQVRGLLHQVHRERTFSVPSVVGSQQSVTEGSPGSTDTTQLTIDNFRRTDVRMKDVSANSLGVDRATAR
jgi:hypothetical protein